MTKFKRGVFASVATMALLASAPAMAFDAVNWDWNGTVDSDVDVDVTVNDELDLSGLTQIESLQIQIGDVSATSTVTDITNDPPEGDSPGGTVTVEIGPEVFSAGGEYTDGNVLFGDAIEDSNNPIDNVEILPEDGDAGGLVVTYIESDSDNVNEFGETFGFDFEVSGTVDVEVPPQAAASLDAETELPTIDSAATAVGNNLSIESDVATMVHSGQLLFDQGDAAVEPSGVDALAAVGAVLAGAALGDNIHTGMAAGAGVLAITNTIGKAEVSASSQVSNIIRGRVDSAATAVGNNMSIEVNADGTPPGDSLLLGDMTQFAAADVTATSDVSSVYVNNYSNLVAAGPLVSSAATAVGNNLSISVGDIGE